MMQSTNQNNTSPLNYIHVLILMVIWDSKLFLCVTMDMVTIIGTVDVTTATPVQHYLQNHLDTLREETFNPTG